MVDRMIRLVTAENIAYPTPFGGMDNINVIRSQYSEETMAYFIRTAAGILLVVNSRLPIEAQAKAISFVKREIEKCGITETGVLKKNFEYFCGGTCCRSKCNSSVI